MGEYDLERYRSFLVVSRTNKPARVGGMAPLFCDGSVTVDAAADITVVFTAPSLNKSSEHHSTTISTGAYSSSSLSSPVTSEFQWYVTVLLVATIATGRDGGSMLGVGVLPSMQVVRALSPRWKVKHATHSFAPIRGCISYSPHATHSFIPASFEYLPAWHIWQSTDPR